MTTVTDEITTALLRDPPEIPSHYGYDAAGSELYAAIMKLDDYYLPAAETSILTMYSGEIMTHAAPTTLIDLGAGTAEKTEYLLAAATNPLKVTLLDVDPTIISSASTRLRTRFPQHTYSTHQGFFHHARPAQAPEERTLIAFLGSTIGNLTESDRGQLLSTLASNCRPTDTLLITADLHDDPARISAAYQCGYTSHSSIRTQFALNRLEALNKIYSADFKTCNFTPGAYYDDSAHDVIAYLRSNVDQRVKLKTIPLALDLDAGTYIIRDRMHKFTPATMRAELEAAGWTITRQWTEKHHGYGAFVASPNGVNR